MKVRKFMSFIIFFAYLPCVAIAKLGESAEQLKTRYGKPTTENVKGNNAQLIFEKDGYKIMCEVLNDKTDFMNVLRIDGKVLENTEVFKFVDENIDATAKWEPENCGQFLLYKSSDGSRLAAFFQPRTILKIFTRERDQAKGLIDKWKAKYQTPKPPNNFPSVEVLKANSAKGDLSADYNLAMAYYSGWGCKRDPCEALKIWEKIANTKSQYSSNSQYMVAGLYLSGDGTVKDEVKAFEWMKKAAENNHPGGQANIGAAYSTGSFGFKKDAAEGLKWTQKAVDQGERMAEYNLGVMYLEGCGVQKDTDRGLKLIQSSADKGYEYAKNFLERRKSQSTTNPQ